MNARFTYRAWHGEGTGSPVHRIDVSHARTFEAALASCPLIHGKTILIAEHDSVTNRELVHAFKVRSKKPRYMRVGSDPIPRMHAETYADPLFVLPVDLFAPVEAFQWTPGCDAVGAPAYKVISA